MCLCLIHGSLESAVRPIRTADDCRAAVARRSERLSASGSMCVRAYACAFPRACVTWFVRVAGDGASSLPMLESLSNGKRSCKLTDRCCVSQLNRLNRRPPTEPNFNSRPHASSWLDSLGCLSPPRPTVVKVQAQRIGRRKKRPPAACPKRSPSGPQVNPFRLRRWCQRRPPRCHGLATTRRAEKRFG